MASPRLLLLISIWFAPFIGTVSPAYPSSQRPDATFSPLSVDYVHDAVVPDFLQWRQRVLSQNRVFHSKMTFLSLGAVEVKKSAQRDDAARIEAARRGGNLVVWTGAEGTYEIYRVLYNGTLIPGFFLGILERSSFRDQEHLAGLFERWIRGEIPERESRQTPGRPPGPRLVPPGTAATDRTGRGAEKTGRPAGIKASPTTEGRNPDAHSTASPKKQTIPAERIQQEKAEFSRHAPAPPPAGKAAPPRTGEIFERTLRDTAPRAGEEISSVDSSPNSGREPEKTKPPRPTDSVAGTTTERPFPERSAFFSAVIPGLGPLTEGDTQLASNIFASQIVLVGAQMISKNNVEKRIDADFNDLFLYRTAKFGTAVFWGAQTVGTYLHYAWGTPANFTPDGAIARSLIFPGWGLLHSGHYITAFNVMAWEGYVLHWATKPNFNRDQRLAALFLVHFGQLALTGTLADRRADARRIAPDVTWGLIPRVRGVELSLAARFSSHFDRLWP